MERDWGKWLSEALETRASGPTVLPEWRQDLDVSQLPEILLGPAAGLDLGQVADLTGAPAEILLRLWMALGFPELEHVEILTSDDLAAATVSNALLEDGVVDEATMINLARAVGQTMARLTDWQVGAMVPVVERYVATHPGVTRLQAFTLLTEHLVEKLQPVMVQVWRRHLVAAAQRLDFDGENDDVVVTEELSVGFADLVGYTELSNRLSEAQLGEMVEDFEGRCSNLITEGSGRLIKSLGDSVLFVHADPVASIEIAEGIVSSVGQDTWLPDVRVGIARGSVTIRLGDVFGPPVNLAARLTPLARRNRIMIDTTTRDLLPSDQFETRPLPPRPLRGFGVVEPVSVSRKMRRV